MTSTWVSPFPFKHTIEEGSLVGITFPLDSLFNRYVTSPLTQTREHRRPFLTVTTVEGDRTDSSNAKLSTSEGATSTAETSSSAP